jgi:transcriptional regulator with XRE-family HTH domain
MTPSEKLERLLKERRIQKNEIAKALGIGYSTFMTYFLSEQQRLKSKLPRMPSADTAVEIARFLAVPAEWLWSKADWPPPPSQDISLLPDSVVVEEALRRRRAARKAFDDVIRRYSTIAKLFKQALSVETRDARGEAIGKHCDELYELLQIAKNYEPMLNAWAGFEGSWEAHEIIRRNFHVQSEFETIKAIEIMSEMSDRKRFFEGLPKLFKLWDAPPDAVDQAVLMFRSSTELSPVEDGGSTRNETD